MALIFSLLFGHGCSWYSKPSYSGRVIDAETGQPLKDVYITISYNIGVQRVVEQGIKAVNTFYLITKNDGMFSVPRVRTVIGLLSWDSSVTFDVHKSGYAGFTSGDIADCMSVGCTEKVFTDLFDNTKKILISSHLIKLQKI